MKGLYVVALVLLSLALAPAQSSKIAAPDDDVVLRAMHDELERSKALKLENLEKPYYIEYSIDDYQNFSISATLGALYAPSRVRLRLPRVRVRVGSQDFDNTNYVFTDYYNGARFDPEQFPLDDDYYSIRRSLWLASDRAFKTAVQAIARKRAALKNITQAETLPDQWRSTPITLVRPSGEGLPATDGWDERVRRLSSIFSSYPDILGSVVSFDTGKTLSYFHNSEGTSTRVPDYIAYVSVRANGQARDGLTVRDGTVVPRTHAKDLPGDPELSKISRQIADNVKALASAPQGEGYAGPVLFDGLSAAQIFAEVLAPNLSLPRRPVAEPSRPTPFRPSDLEGRTGSRVLPDFMTVVDDATQTSYKGAPLFGHYIVDEEGVVPKPLVLIEKGRLQNFLLTRQPVKGFTASNGHARIPGPYGAREAMIGNLFVRADETISAAELKARLLQIVKDRNKPYGILVRKMDYPTSAPADEVRRTLMSAVQRGGGRPVSSPVLLYRVYPDGREELVRGLRFRDLGMRSLRDIVAASDENHVFHFLNSPSPFAMSGSGFVAPASVIAPSILIDDVELELPQEEKPRLPVVDPPALVSQAATAQ